MNSKILTLIGFVVFVFGLTDFVVGVVTTIDSSDVDDKSKDELTKAQYNECKPFCEQSESCDYNLDRCNRTCKAVTNSKTSSVEDRCKVIDCHCDSKKIASDISAGFGHEDFRNIKVDFKKCKSFCEKSKSCGYDVEKCVTKEVVIHNPSAKKTAKRFEVMSCNCSAEKVL
ncbi:Uncharacterised protein g11013 [Pycnogonum litorale]